MPYAATSDIPDSVRSHLTAHAQEIYPATFNYAWEEYGRREEREAVVHKVAWALVK